MVKSSIAVVCAILLTTQFAYASCDTTNIPGYFTDRYVDNEDGTITDKMTNLMWMKCDLDIPWDDTIKICFHDDAIQGGGDGRTPYTWQAALEGAQNTNISGFAGFDGWRLPNIKELGSILALHCLTDSRFTALNTEFFDGTASFYWSSTPDRNEITTFGDESSINKAWMISFKNAVGLGAGKSNIEQLNNVRLVRSISQ